MNPIEDWLPKLRSSAYRITSPEDVNYNCIAWAADADDMFWWPDQQRLYHWPRSVPRTRTLGSFRQAFSQYGYEPCDSPRLEPGYEKVAIFVNSTGAPTHAARQLRSGRWTSKLGRAEDIEHDLDALEGDAYGLVAVVMKRPWRHLADPDQDA